jgi:hypothetical protein
VPLAQEGVVILQYARSPRNAIRFTFDFDIVIDQLGMDAQGFDQPYVLIPGPKEALDASLNAHACFH